MGVRGGGRRGPPILRDTGDEEDYVRTIPDQVLMRRLLNYLAPYKRQLVSLVAVIGLTTATTSVAPFLIKRMIDDFIVKGNLQGLDRKSVV